MSLPQLARMRNNRFAQVQVQSQIALFDDTHLGAASPTFCASFTAASAKPC